MEPYGSQAVNTQQIKFLVFKDLYGPPHKGKRVRKMVDRTERKRTPTVNLGPYEWLTGVLYLSFPQFPCHMEISCGKVKAVLNTIPAHGIVDSLLTFL